MFLDRKDYDTLATIVFQPSYPGWKPDVKEIPNGDGKVDVKKYAHIAPKYLPGFGTGRQRSLLMRALFRAHEVAEAVADVLNVPQAFRPDIRYGAVRVLAYPAETGISHPHTDFDLFTIPLFRDQPECFVRYEHQDLDPIAEDIAPGLHIGELGEAIGLGPATRHEVLPHPEGQLSAVYFAIPDWDAPLPEGPARDRVYQWLLEGGTGMIPPTVKDFLNERMARSRTEFKAYQ